MSFPGLMFSSSFISGLPCLMYQLKFLDVFELILMSNPLACSGEKSESCPVVNVIQKL